MLESCLIKHAYTEVGVTQVKPKEGTARLNVGRGPTKLHDACGLGSRDSHSLVGRGEGDMKLAIGFPSEQAGGKETWVYWCL